MTNPLNYEAAKQLITDLLTKWQRGEIPARTVHEEAEYVCEQHDLVDFPETDARFIVNEILSGLGVMNNELIGKEDIPAILAYLHTPPGKEKQAWEDYCRYWNAIDIKARELRRGNKYYLDEEYS